MLYPRAWEKKSRKNGARRANLARAGVRTGKMMIIIKGGEIWCFLKKKRLIFKEKW
jgi:hypothetical protein